MQRLQPSPTVLQSKPPKRKQETEQLTPPLQSDREHLVLDLQFRLPLLPKQCVFHNTTLIPFHIGPRHTTGRENTLTKVAK